jgi:pimeloyl-ACP methyl ester carboxylesterase
MCLRRWFLALSILLVAVAAVWVYLYRRDVRMLELDPPRSRYHGTRTDAKGVIVFVHGILGDSRSTWTNSANGKYWPALIKADPAFLGFNVYINEFATPVVAPAMAIDALADNLHDHLLDARVFDHDEVIVLAHSMGGLISRAFASRYQKYSSKIKLLFFYSAPTLGSDIANVFWLGTRNPQLGKMRVIESPDYLADQLRSWINAGPQIPTYCAYEELETFGAIVVSIGSAAALCGIGNSRVSGIRANHIDIVKPRDPNDDIHIAFRNAFLQVHEKVETWRIPPNMDLGQVIRTFVASENRQVEFGASCTRSLLRTRVSEGEVRGRTLDVIERLPDRLIPRSSLRLRARQNERGIYEIECTL